MTDPADTDLALAAEFPPATDAQWRALVDGVLKDAPFETLQSRTADDLVIEPLYGRPAQAARIAGRVPGARWQVMARIDHPDAAAANAEALAELMGGANGLVLVGAGSVGAHGFGLPPTPAAIERVLERAELDAGIAIELDAGLENKELAHTLASRVTRRGIQPAPVDIRFGIDPIAVAAHNGGSPMAANSLGLFAAKLAGELATQGFGRAIIAADGRVVHAAGGTEAQELAFVLAVAVAYLRALAAVGITLDQARRMIFFRLAADADQILTITKFRALRQLWQHVEENCGLKPHPVFIAAETAWRTMTRNDPYANILRATIAVFAAGVGGADAITVLPFTAARGLSDRFARRVARNTQLVLLDEANVAKVADPAAGTGWSEELGGRLCATAWSLFQEIESAGGAAAALEHGLIQRKVATARAARERAVATRRLALIGVNKFPHLGEVPIAVLDVAPVSLTTRPAVIAIEPLAPMRLAAPFEVLRNASDRHLTTTGERPRIFLANLGTLAEFTASAAAAKNFFAAGGIEAISSDGFASDHDMVLAFKGSGARLACLCGSDKILSRNAAGAARALKDAGAPHLYVAANPREHESQWRSAGIDTFITASCDALAILQAAHRHLD